MTEAARSSQRAREPHFVLELGGTANDYNGCSNVLIAEPPFDFGSSPLRVSQIGNLKLVPCTQDLLGQVPGALTGAFAEESTSLTARRGARICLQVIKVRPRLTPLLIAVWIAVQSPWSGGLPMLAHAASGGHEASLSWSRGHLNVVLHHPPADPDHHTPSSSKAGHHGDAAKHKRANHLLHLSTSDQALTSRGGGSSLVVPVCVALASWQSLAPPQPCEDSPNDSALQRSSPTLDALRTTILLV